MLEQQAGWISAIAIILVLALGRALFGDEDLKRDLRGSISYLVGYLLLRFAATQLDGSGLETAEQLVKVGSYLLFSFGVIRGCASIVLYVVRTTRQVPTPKILRDLLDAVLYLIAFAVILRVTLKVDLGTLVGTSAVLSVVIGLALQETLGNLFAGLSLQVERPFYVGDWITVGHHTGKVVNVAWRATRILTRRNEYITIPNAAVAKESVINYTRAREGVATEFLFELAYEVPPNEAFRVCMTVLKEHPLIPQSPPPEFRVNKFASSGVEYEVRFFVHDYPDAENLQHEVHTRLWYALRRAGMTIPYPTRTLYMQQVTETTTARMEEQREISQLLSHIDFLRPLGPEGLERLASRSHRHEFGRGEVVIRQGEQGDTFYVIMHGELGVQVSGSTTEVARLQRGDFVGEMSLLTGEPRAANVNAATDATLLVVDRASFAEHLSSHQELAQGISEALARRREHLRLMVAGGTADDGAVKQECSRILLKLRDIFRLR